MSCLIFVDESGDTGFKFEKGSSRFFVLVLVIFDRPEDANTYRSIIQVKIEDCWEL